MKIVCAPDSYGGFLSAPEACQRIAQHLRGHGMLVERHPMCDGGEGLIEAWAAHHTIEIENLGIPDPFGDPIRVPVATHGSVHLVEAARILGLAMMEHPLRPRQASSIGLGTTLVRLNQRRPAPILVGLGGTATVDGGLGLAQGLGLKILDHSGRALPLGAGAEMLAKADKLIGRPPVSVGLVRVLADVRTPLSGAIAKYGPQKGVTKAQVPELEKHLEHWAGVVNRWRTRQGWQPVPLDRISGGAGGGLGFGLQALASATVLPGAETFARMTGLADRCRNADLVITGEGRIDGTSFEGKVVESVIETARSAGARVVALVGSAHSVPAPPQGPDHVIEAGPSSDETRTEAFDAAISQLANWIAQQSTPSIR